MSVYNIRINQRLLDCTYCGQPLRPDTSGGKAWKCAGVHIFCRACVSRHEQACISYCSSLDQIISKMKFKYNCCDSEYIPFHEIEGHLCDINILVHHEFFAVRDYGECIIDTSALVCSECRLPLRPPIFRHLRKYMHVCSICYHRGDFANYHHCHDLDYLVEGISVECEACKEYLPFSTLASHQLDGCSFRQTLPKIAPGCAQSPQCPLMSSSPVSGPLPPPSVPPKMSVFNLRISQGLLDCTYCHRALLPDSYGGRAFTCAGSHLFCRDCDTRHQKACISHCGLMDDIIIQMKFKSNCCDSGRKYTPYCEFAGHLCTTRAVEQQLKSVRAWKECILDTSALVCSECRLPLQPPIFRHLLGNMPVCSACYHRGDIANYRHCHELDYLVSGILVECEACKEYLPFRNLASHQLDNCSLKIGPGSRARKNVCDEDKTKSPSVGSNSIHGKNKRMPPLEVGKMDKHIVHSDESGNDDDSCDDNHNHGTCEHVFSCEDDSIDKMDEGKEVENPETVKGVTENAFKTPCEKAEIAMPNGQKTGKNKRKAPYGVDKMDKYIVHGDEVGNDDSSGGRHGAVAQAHGRRQGPALAHRPPLPWPLFCSSGPSCSSLGSPTGISYDADGSLLAASRNTACGNLVSSRALCLCCTNRLDPH
ncbi:uncharacterized protein LOC120694352 isoform X1 [Panicum virgatum]|uniref:uncharacterized protein LOC120694352 isoform X1 n=1 Tax=Panicum virgatum TaxID=38727 RepID=UPI0019D5CA8A|nr:uncharacterized protein LOC120694352 isoform X1 [Panicum virgatum]KAG2481124.1 hypothetical protein PVAP13_J683456 [Panicum virgatum]